MEGINRYNDKAISRAQRIQSISILPEDFNVDNGTLTSTLKLKRREVLQKYATTIESMYIESKLWFVWDKSIKKNIYAQLLLDEFQVNIGNAQIVVIKFFLKMMNLLRY
jgi:hypothetical protein